jgi:hypothetical protein
MGASAEVLLMASVVGLYCYDASTLLYCNEGLLIPQGRNDWRMGFGSCNFRVLGKELYFPNPFQLHRPMFRLSWRFEGADECAAWNPPGRSFPALTPTVWGMAVALFMLLPLGLSTRLGDRMLLLALVLLFANILIALSWIWFNRAIFGLSGRQFAGLAFESLICPPFALNLVQRVSMNIPVREDLVSVARRLQSPAAWAATRASLLARLDEELESEDADSARFGMLQARRRILADEGHACQA